MRVTDMTEGSPAKKILTFAVPLFIGNIFQQIYSVVDTMVAGYNLGDQAIAAIGATGAMVSLITDAAFGMNSGFSVIITQRFGEKDADRLKRAVAGTILLNLLTAAWLTLASLLFARPLLHILQVPGSIFRDAYRYVFVIFAGMAASVAFNMFSGILRAVGNSVTPLYFLIIACVVNILLDVWMVAFLGLGVAGAAFATVLSQLLSAVLSGRYLWRHYQDILPEREHFRMTMKMFRELFSTGFAMAFMYCVVDLGNVLLQSAGNSLGDLYITANTAFGRVARILMAPLMTTTTASATFVGQNYGAGRMERIRKGIREAIGIELIWSVLSLLLTLVFGGRLLQLITGTKNAEVIHYALLQLFYSVPFFPLLSVLFAMRTSMQAMGIKLPPAISSILELLVKWGVAVWLLPSLGYFAICIGTPITWSVMTAYLTASYFARRKTLYQGKEKQV